MKKGFIMILLAFAISWLTSCEKEVFDINPMMEAYYMESMKLPSATLDSVKSFSSKIEGFTRSYPWAVEHQRYPQIKENIKSASIRITLEVDTTWAGVETYHF